MRHLLDSRSLQRFVCAATAAAPLVLAGGVFTIVSAPARAQYAFAEYSSATEPSVIVTRLMITTQRFTRYRPDPNKEPTYGQWSWTPRFAFGIRGPIQGGGQVVVNVTKPNGQPWLSLPIDTPELGPGEWKAVKTDDQEETKGITPAGVCSYSIVLKNALQGTSKVLYSGKFEVLKYRDPLNKKPGETEYYINQDWRLATGLLEIDTNTDDEAPLLTTYFWFKGDESANSPEGYVFYNGKQIYSTKTPGQGAGVADVTLTTPGVDKEKTWFRWRFEFGGVRIYRREKDQSANNYTQFFLNKNPGEYEVKVLRAGKLSRVMKFTVGADGKIVDNGIAARNHYSTTQMFMPVQALPGSDVPFSLTLTPTSFYGDPPK